MQQQRTPQLRPRLAVLIDAENAHAAHLTKVMSRAYAYGRPTVRRAYGNWMTPQLIPWKKVMQQMGIQPCQQFPHLKGKNVADFALVMDAMQLMHEGRVDGFCLMSSDSDFTGLAVRIREYGLPVYGFGRRDTAHTFLAACDTFAFLDAA